MTDGTYSAGEFYGKNSQNSWVWVGWACTRSAGRAKSEIRGWLAQAATLSLQEAAADGDLIFSERIGLFPCSSRTSLQNVHRSTSRSSRESVNSHTSIMVGRW